MYREEARKVFALLVSGRRPPTLAETAEAVAVDLNTNSFDPKNRLRDARSVLKICHSFISLVEPNVWPFRGARVASSETERILRFAHYSVHEFLMSDRVAGDFRLTVQDANAIVARLSLSYILSVSGTMPPVSSTLELLPFIVYASSNWSLAYANSNKENDQHNISLLTCRLFTTDNEAKLKYSIYISDPDKAYKVPFQDMKYISRLYYACLYGLLYVCINIVDDGADVNAQGGYYGNALQAASSRGHREIVELLLNNGADVNAQGRYYGNALQDASWGGHREIVELLLNNGCFSFVI